MCESSSLAPLTTEFCLRANDAARRHICVCVGDVIFATIRQSNFLQEEALSILITSRLSLPSPHPILPNSRPSWQLPPPPPSAPAATPSQNKRPRRLFTGQFVPSALLNRSSASVGSNPVRNPPLHEDYVHNQRN